jgi:hypothetical protein
LLPGFRKSREFLSGAPDIAPADSEAAEDEFDEANDQGEEPSLVAKPYAVGRLAPEQIERLQAALDELGECRRLIDEAFAQAGE